MSAGEIQGMNAFLRKNWFFAGIFIVILLAFGFPGSADGPGNTTS